LQKQFARELFNSSVIPLHNHVGQSQNLPPFPEKPHTCAVSKRNTVAYLGNRKSSTMNGGRMESVLINERNPLADLISDEIYDLLCTRGLIDEKSVRDFIIRRKFKNMRSKKVSASDAIETLRNEYPYLQFDTIRKIVYQPKN